MAFEEVVQGALVQPEAVAGSLLGPAQPLEVVMWFLGPNRSDLKRPTIAIR